MDLCAFVHSISLSPSKNPCSEFLEIPAPLAVFKATKKKFLQIWSESSLSGNIAKCRNYLLKQPPSGIVTPEEITLQPEIETVRMREVISLVLLLSSLNKMFSAERIITFWRGETSAGMIVRRRRHQH